MLFPRILNVAGKRVLFVLVVFTLLLLLFWNLIQIQPKQRNVSIGKQFHYFNLPQTRKKLFVENTTVSQVKPVCPLIPPEIGSRSTVNKTITDWEKLEAVHPELLLGGRFTPAECTSQDKVAIIIPYRDREDNLKVLLQNLHPFLQRQRHDYGIFVVEQTPNVTFNRGMMKNIGFTEASKSYDYDCFIFHDVDLVPMDDRNRYTCYNMPRHIGVEIDERSFKLRYPTLIGGVLALKKEHMEIINGYSNLYFGWGSEDDDLCDRILSRKLDLARDTNHVNRYTALKHVPDYTNPNPIRHKLWRKGYLRSAKDGLNSLTYKVVQRDFKTLFTRILVHINETEIMGRWNITTGQMIKNITTRTVS